ncbi:MAG: hypothetical protein H6670_10765 [Anaerolineaceae bacterium]|nr:hypothetical protein [Anaerolineaceae bacterium]
MNPTFTDSNRTDLTYSEKPMYHFETSFNDDYLPTLEAIKTWQGGQQKLTLGAYGMMEEAFTQQHELVELRANEGLEASMRLAETMAVSSGSLDAARPDGRLFSDGPPDPFTTDREQELATLDYTYDIVPHSGGTFELQSLKTWEMDGKPQMESLALGEYDTVNDARREQTIVSSIRSIDGLQEEMNMVERIAIENGTLDPDRNDPRLFTQGPTDPFRTQMQREMTIGLSSPPTVQPVELQSEADIHQESHPVLAISVDMDM